MDTFPFTGAGFENEASWRLVDLLRKNRVLSSSVPDDVATLEESLQKLDQAWNDPSESFLFYRDDPDVANKFPMAKLIFQRVQNSGNCMMNAVVMLQHYLIAKFNHSASVPPILDIKEYLRTAASNRELNDYIFYLGETS
jgi:hypothetical protein